MDYLIKASAILGIFYLFYKLFLERETFFQSNRIFLIVGILSALIIPLIVIPIYTEQVATTLSQFSFSETTQNTVDIQKSFNWPLLFEYIYISGLLFFAIRLLISISALAKFIIFGNVEKIGSYLFIKTTKDVSPFSFFNYIIYNPISFKQEELNQILTHEKVHAFQRHSFDVLLSQIMTTFFWFNPFSWLYKKDLQQNLEFIADSVSQDQMVCEKTYQKLLLKTSVVNNQLALTNNFYSSLIKKRIIMLQKIRSKNRNQWKFTLILPFLIAFIFAFQTKLVAQDPKPVKIEVKELKEVKKTKDEKKLVKVKEIHKNIEAFMITKDATDLDDIQKKLLEKGVTAKFKNLKRNSKGEITSIKIDLKSKTSSANFAMNSDTPIKPIKITIDEDGSKLSIGSVSGIHGVFFDKKDHDGENVFIIEKKHGNNELHEIKVDGDKHKVIEITDKNVWVTKDGNKTVEIILDGDKHEVIEITDKKVWVTKDGTATVEIKHGDDKHEVIEIKTDGDHNGAVFISEDGTSKVKFELADSKNKPMILVDGKEMAFEKMEKLDPDTFESINVLKGDSAIKKYGNKAKNGVIEITSKKE